MNEDIMSEPIIDDKSKIVTPTDPTPQDPKADEVKTPVVDIEAIIAAVTKSIEEKAKKASDPKPTEQNPVVESDDELFDKRFQAYEKKKFIASLDADSKKSLDGLPSYDTLSVEQLQWILNKVKTVVGAEPKAKTFPPIDNGAPFGTTAVDKDEYIKKYKEAEKKMRGGK